MWMTLISIDYDHIIISLDPAEREGREEERREECPGQPGSGIYLGPEEVTR